MEQPKDIFTMSIMNAMSDFAQHYNEVRFTADNNKKQSLMENMQKIIDRVSILVDNYTKYIEKYGNN